MFAICLLPPSVRGGDRERLGRVTIGTFTELFACYPPRGTSVRSMPARWRGQLRRLIRGDVSAVALVHDPRFAWIVYRVGSRCYVRQKGSLDGDFTHIASRQTRNDEGERISEWATTPAEIARFARSRPNHAMQRTAPRSDA